jgi:hypothetical protein
VLPAYLLAAMRSSRQPDLSMHARAGGKCARKRYLTAPHGTLGRQVGGDHDVVLAPGRRSVETATGDQPQAGMVDIAVHCGGRKGCIREVLYQAHLGFSPGVAHRRTSRPSRYSPMRFRTESTPIAGMTTRIGVDFRIGAGCLRPCMGGGQG